MTERKGKQMSETGYKVLTGGSGLPADARKETDVLPNLWAAEFYVSAMQMIDATLGFENIEYTIVDLDEDTV